MVEWFKIHPNYKELETSDIAVIKLQTPFVFSDKLNKIDLDDQMIGGGVNAKLSGWGYTRPIRFGNLPEDLQTLDYKTLTNEECNRSGYNVTKTEICTYKGLFRGACAVIIKIFYIRIFLKFLKISLHFFVGRFWWSTG